MKRGNIITYYYPHKRHSDGFHMITDTKAKGSKSNVTRKPLLGGRERHFKLMVWLDLGVHFKISRIWRNYSSSNF